MEPKAILIQPVITEKSMDEAAHNRFTFVVAKHANKTEVKKAVEAQFKVNVLSVQTITVKGKARRAGRRRMEVKTPAFKKAIVRLKDGQNIDLFDVQKEEKGKQTT